MSKAPQQSRGITEEGAGAEIAAPAGIGCKTQISHAAHVANAQKRPEQEHSSNQNGAMKECFEIVPCQKRKYAVRCKRLSRPKKNWRKDRSDDNRRDKICRQFNYVFQGR